MKNFKFLLLSLSLIIGFSTCRKKCNDASNSNCEILNPCLFYPKANAQIQVFEKINDLEIVANEFLEGENVGLKNIYTFGEDYWSINNIFQNLSQKEYYYTFHDTGNQKVVLENVINRNEACEGGNFTAIVSTNINILSKREGGVENDKTKPYNKNCKWLGKFIGNSNGSISITEIELYRKEYITSNGKNNKAEIFFPKDTCLGLYLIDNFGFNSFSSDFQLSTSPICSLSKPYFTQIYGIANNKGNIIINLIEDKTKEKITFYGKKI